MNSILKTLKFQDVPYAISTSKQVSHKPIRVNDMVLFRKKEDNSIVCMKDSCPHRGARLSQGFVNKDDELVCPYHGWSFDQNGMLCSMPSHKASSPVCHIPTIPVVEDGNYVWMNYNHGYIDQHCPELNDPNWGKVVGSKEVKGNWFDWVSNSWDVSHINFVHDFGDEENGVVHNLKSWKDLENEQVLFATCKVNPKPINFTTNHMQKKKVQVSVKAILPNTTRIDVEMKEPYKFITFTSIMPLSMEKSLLTWSFLWNFGNTFWEKSVLIQREFEKEMHKTISEDENIIQNIDHNIPYVSVPADALQLKATQIIEELVSKHKIVTM